MTCTKLSQVKLLFLVCLVCSICISSSSAEEQSFTVEKSILSNNVIMNSFNEKGINAWGLNRKELNEYQQVIQGNRKFWSPNLHPLAALGMKEGVTAEQRDALAEKLVHIERKRLEREIAFEKAFQAANRRHYSHIPLFNADPITTTRNSKVKSSTSIYSKYLNYYVSLPCPQCKNPIQKWLKEGKYIDLYIDSKSDSAIRMFAKDMGISPLLVPSRVRLNKTSKMALLKAGISNLPHVEERE